MLSPKERAFLRNELQGISKGYKADLLYHIRKKFHAALEDLKLIVESNKARPEAVPLTRREYFYVFIPFVKAVQNYYFESFLSEIREFHDLANGLDEAGIRYDYKKLCTDEKYRRRLWRRLLSKNPQLLTQKKAPKVPFKAIRNSAKASEASTRLP